MQYSRAGIVAVLLAVEASLAGGIISQAHGLRPQFSSDSGTTAYAFDAGAAPRVVVDDRSSRVYVEPSVDGRVHIQDENRAVGFVWGTPRSPLSVHRTPDGVSIQRSGAPAPIAIFGFSEHGLHLQVPAKTVLEARGCAGVTLSGLRASSVAVECQDGSIRATDLAVGGGSLHTADGSIHVAFAPSDLTVHAATGEGSMRIDGRRLRSDGDRIETTFQMGAGTGRLDLATADGSVHITTGELANYAR